MEILELVLLCLVGALGLMLMYIRSNYFIHMAQQIGYISKEYRDWINNHPGRAFTFKKSKDEFKKPLVYTPRVKRLIFTQMLLNFLIIALFVVFYFIRKPDGITFYLLLLALIFVEIVMIFYQNAITYFALNVNRPIEAMIHRKFYKQAQSKIKNFKKNGLTVVGITGSYGKTSTKMILYNILKDYIPTYTSPESFNTPMGLSKVINNELDESARVFIAEMGARYVNEIEELAKLVKPDIGVITNIGPCHLETFGSIENIITTKFELADAVKKDGYLILNVDNENIKNEMKKRNLTPGTVSVKSEDATISAKILSADENGTSFEVHFPEEVRVLKTPLLGEHNIINILMAILVARRFNISNDQIEAAVSKLPQVEHRLNVIKNPAGLIVIDDAFNSNPDGARAALNVLNSFKSGKKVIVTPGMVELGDMMYDENYKLGQEIARMTDISILVGEEITKPIQDGVGDENIETHKSFVVNSLKEATALFPNLLAPGDVVLFENDLTDIY